MRREGGEEGERYFVLCCVVLWGCCIICFRGWGHAWWRVDVSQGKKIHACFVKSL